MSHDSTADGVTIRRCDSEAEAQAAAEIMSSSEPWITYGRTRENTFVTVWNPDAESYVAVTGAGQVVGVVILALRVPLIRGYVAGLAVHCDWRNRGLGTRLLKHAEDRIFQVSPNVFICVTSFNTGAQRLYERLGYRKVGQLDDFAIAGAHEHLLRKTLGPQATFKPLSVEC